MNNKEIYAICDLDGYVSDVRTAAAKSLCEDSTEDLDQYISLKQMVGIVNSECLGYDDNNRPLLNEETNQKIFESVVSWIHNIGLAKLAAQDLIECAWDDKTNEMIFWAKKAKTNAKSNKRRNKKKDTGS